MEDPSESTDARSEPSATAVLGPKTPLRPAAPSAHGRLADVVDEVALCSGVGRLALELAANARIETARTGCRCC
jgi:hypothetical protein